MKKTFLARRNSILSPTDLSWGVFALAFVLIILLVRILSPNFFLYIFTPAFRAADSFAAEGHRIISSFDNSATLSAQNEQLIKETSVLTAMNKSLLQKIANIGTLSKAKTGILAGVIARPPESPYDTLVLAAGTNVGVALGMEAFGIPAQADLNLDGVPLGVVSSVSADFSRVTLFSAPNFVTNGWVGEKGLPLTIRGVGAGAMQATAARSAAITVGDAVFASGPGMLMIGNVIRIDNDLSLPAVTLRIQTVLNPFSIAWVSIRDTGVQSSGLATSTLP